MATQLQDAKIKVQLQSDEAEAMLAQLEERLKQLQQGERTAESAESRREDAEEDRERTESDRQQQERRSRFADVPIVGTAVRIAEIGEFILPVIESAIIEILPTFLQERARELSPFSEWGAELTNLRAQLDSIQQATADTFTMLKGQMTLGASDASVADTFTYFAQQRQISAALNRLERDRIVETRRLMAQELARVVGGRLGLIR